MTTPEAEEPPMTTTETQCASCRSVVTLVAMDLADGTHVDFASCSSCERRGWLMQGRPVAASEVLARSRVLS